MKGEENKVNEQGVWGKRYNLDDGWARGGVMEEEIESYVKRKEKV